MRAAGIEAKKNTPKRGLGKVAARPGLEPRLNEPESLVLPLHHRAGWTVFRAGMRK